jgi:hypothetical protein
MFLTREMKPHQETLILKKTRVDHKYSEEILQMFSIYSIYNEFLLIQWIHKSR